MSTPPIEIDGSFGEGGGQIIRNAVSLSVILRKPIRISSIRSNRPNPGLASQHLESILALKRISGVTTNLELKKGMTEFQLNGDGKDPNIVDTTIDLITAGSVSLCVQVLLPYLLTLQSGSRLVIIGGTHVMKAPNYDYLIQIFIPLMKTIGYEFDIRLKKPGYFPRGGGSIELQVQPNAGDKKFNHFKILHRGKLTKQSAILNMTPRLAEAQPRFLSCIKSTGIQEIEPRTVPYSSIEYFLHYEHTRVGLYKLVEGRNPTQPQLLEAIKLLNEEYKKFISSEAAVDEYMQDQLIIYMALAKMGDPAGESSIRVGPLSDHTKSAIHVVELVSGVEFKIKEEDGSWVISV